MSSDKGGRRKRSKTILGLVLACLLILPLSYCQLWPRLSWNPIDRFTFVQGPSRSMIPEVFAPDETRALAIARLTEAGYAHAVLEAEPRRLQPCGDTACERIREGYTDFFRKSVPPVSPMNLACNIDYVVWLSFNGDNRLLKARNDLYTQCL